MRHHRRFAISLCGLFAVLLGLIPRTATAQPRVLGAAAFGAHVALPVLGAAAVGAHVALPVLGAAVGGSQGAIPALPDAARELLGVAFRRVVQSGREVAPGLVERLENMMQQRQLGENGQPKSAARRTSEAVLQVSGVAIIGAVLALLVLVTALGPLEGMIRTIEIDVSAAFWRGLLAQVITLPIIAVVLLGLALTVIGLLAVPIVLMASTLAMAGVSTLGVLAVAAVIGRARAKGETARTRAGLLRAVLIGYAIVWLPWVLAALFVAVPGVGLTTRIIALASTWVVATVGTGAVFVSRGGLRVPDARGHAALSGSPSRQPDWSTPTPVTGVVAARRPLTGGSATVE